MKQNIPQNLTYLRIQYTAVGSMVTGYSFKAPNNILFQIMNRTKTFFEIRPWHFIHHDTTLVSLMRPSLKIACTNVKVVLWNLRHCNNLCGKMKVKRFSEWVTLQCKLKGFVLHETVRYLCQAGNSVKNMNIYFQVSIIYSARMEFGQVNWNT